MKKVSPMIFAAGYGKRLKPLTDETPKPLLPVGSSCCLDRSIKILKDAGCKKIVINAHHLAEKIENHCKSDADLIVIHEDTLLETGGGLVNALAYLDEDNILTMNSDIWMESPSFMSDLIEQFDEEKMDMLLLLVSKKNVLFSDLVGDYNFNKDQRSIHHRGQNSFADYVYTGIQICSKKFIRKNCPNKQHFSMRYFFDIAEKNNRLFGLDYKSKWSDIGTLFAYERIKDKDFS